MKGIEARQAIDMIASVGLKVSSIHDAGEVVNNALSIQGFINPQVDEYVEHLGYAPGCIVFHTPHIEGGCNRLWWQSVSEDIVKAVERYRTEETFVTIENMPFFDGYYVPLTTPQELLGFVVGNEIGVTLDTTHYAQIGTDIVQAAGILQEKVKTIHLSNYVNGKTCIRWGWRS